MSQITLEIPDNKLSFFMELVKNLGFINVASPAFAILTAEQVTLVEAARKKAKEHPDTLKDWEEALDKIDWDAR